MDFNNICISNFFVMEVSGATVVISHHIKKGKDQEYEKWLNEIGPLCRNAIGLIDWQIIRPIQGLTYLYTVIIRFDTIAHLKSWMESDDIGYMFENVKGKPTINLRNDYISGDSRKGDGRLGTFNPLYPKGGYFGFNPQIGPVNLIDIHPYATLDLSEKITVQADVVFNWRYSLQDGIYRPSGTLNLASSDSKKRYIGTAFLGSFNYKINKFLTFNTRVQYLNIRDFINEVNHKQKDGLYINSRIEFKF